MYIYIYPISGHPYGAILGSHSLGCRCCQSLSHTLTRCDEPGLWILSLAVVNESMVE